MRFQGLFLALWDTGLSLRQDSPSLIAKNVHEALKRREREFQYGKIIPGIDERILRAAGILKGKPKDEPPEDLTGRLFISTCWRRWGSSRGEPGTLLPR
jgi:hypothetical protein